MTAKTTRDWLDLYSMILDRLAEHLADPTKMQEHFQIKEGEEGSIKPGKLNMDSYKELRSSWSRVRSAIESFGLDMNEDLMLEPMPEVMATRSWMQSPFLNVSRESELLPVRFKGRDALTAFGFINFFIQHCESINPTLHVRKTLESQGITKENFDQHRHLLGISNPWAE